VIEKDKTKIVLSNPEQHIDCFAFNKGAHLNVHFTVSVLPDETDAAEVLYRMAQTIIKQLRIESD
jgi:hypothetical protein